MIIALLALLLGAGGGFGLAQGTTSNRSVADMSSTMDGMTKGLADLSGTQFEQAFLTEMIVHHQGAVRMAQMVLERTDRPELVQLANAIITAQTGEIALMRGWQSAWFSTSSAPSPHATH